MLTKLPFQSQIIVYTFSCRYTARIFWYTFVVGWSSLNRDQSLSCSLCYHICHSKKGFHRKKTLGTTGPSSTSLDNEWCSVLRYVLIYCICVLELIMTVCIGFIHHIVIYFHRNCISSIEIVSTAPKKKKTCILPMSVDLKQPNCSHIPGTIPVRLSKPVTD